MTFNELLNGIQLNGDFPDVKCNGVVGRVTAIKNRTDARSGCAVKFPGYQFNMWFWENVNDGRRGLDSLELVNNDPSTISVALFRNQWVEIQDALLFKASKTAELSGQAKELQVPGMFTQCQHRQIELTEIATIIEKYLE